MDSDDILRAISSGQFVVSVHGLERMKLRQVFEIDICHVADSCVQIFEQSHGTWKIEGYDTHFDFLTVIAAKEDDLVIVTVF